MGHKHGNNNTHNDQADGQQGGISNLVLLTQLDYECLNIFDVGFFILFTVGHLGIAEQHNHHTNTNRG